MIGQRIYSTQCTHSRQINAIHSKVDDWLMDWKNSVKRAAAPPAVYYILLIMCVCLGAGIYACSLHEARRRHSDISCVCHIQTNWRSRNRRAAVLIIFSSSLPLGDPKKLKGKDTHTWTSISPTHMCVLLLRRPKNYITHKSVWDDLSIIYRRQYKYIAGNLIDITTINGKPPLSF